MDLARISGQRAHQQTHQFLFVERGAQTRIAKHVGSYATSLRSSAQRAPRRRALHSANEILQ